MIIQSSEYFNDFDAFWIIEILSFLSSIVPNRFKALASTKIDFFPDLCKNEVEFDFIHWMTSKTDFGEKTHHKFWVVLHLISVTFRLIDSG